ncbi:uncharacterized protein EI90DRAFT_3164606 [Cantharellus anzutake]|uniref:uncharacterized protein n=1 Tax=Cantharellus anzutake TaxID=1750568 RepID=UPI0019044DB0|nr:uncharacterized protein EI90DRAFT_3164606 [Cantharellus anzutake]KAF8344018.1 hypothetical protein EI90DRAFT_3164606 [Cantharellus anzutake]
MPWASIIRALSPCGHGGRDTSSLVAGHHSICNELDRMKASSLNLKTSVIGVKTLTLGALSRLSKDRGHIDVVDVFDPNRAQLAGYAVELFSASGLRRHLLGHFIQGTNFEPRYFNRSGLYRSIPIPFGENFRNLRFEPFIHPPSGPGEGLRSADRAYFLVKGKTRVTRGEKNKRGRSIKGRGTMVWAIGEVKQREAATVEVVKLSGS